MVYLLLADGFEEIEAITPLDILRRCGIAVKTVGVFSKQITGAHGITVETDLLIDDADAETMRALILPGGPGHTRLDESSDVQRLINYAAANNLYIAAICAAPSILGKKGLLNGKKATCFPGYEQYLYGAEIIEEKVVTDGKYITARGAGAASEFGFAIARKLTNPDNAEQIKAAMQY